MRNNGKVLVFVLIFVLILIVLVAVYFVVAKVGFQKVGQPQHQDKTQNSQTESLPTIAGWQNYSNDSLGVSFQYPTEWGSVSAAAYSIAPGFNMITFSNMQMFPDANKAGVWVIVGQKYDKTLGRNQTFDEAVSENKQSIQTLQSQNNITVNGKPAISLNGVSLFPADSKTHIVMVQVDSNGGILGAQEIIGSKSSATFDDFDKFISTIKIAKGVATAPLSSSVDDCTAKNYPTIFSSVASKYGIKIHSQAIYNLDGTHDCGVWLEWGAATVLPNNFNDCLSAIQTIDNAIKTIKDVSVDDVKLVGCTRP